MEKIYRSQKDFEKSCRFCWQCNNHEVPKQGFFYSPITPERGLVCQFLIQLLVMHENGQNSSSFPSPGWKSCCCIEYLLKITGCLPWTASKVNKQILKSTRSSMKGMQLWSNTSKWLWRYHNLSQSILNRTLMRWVSVKIELQNSRQLDTTVFTNTFCNIQIKVTADMFQIPDVINIWAADCRYMWAEGEIFKIYELLQRFPADFARLILNIKGH